MIDRYRGVIPIFVYHCLMNKPFTVYRGHKRIFDYVEDTCRTFANIVDSFIPGEVYNIGGKEEWIIGIEDLAYIILKETRASPSLAIFKEGENFTTRMKMVDFSKSRRDLKHNPKIEIHEGIRRYVEWMKKVYDL